MKTIQNTSKAMNCPLSLILKFKTIFDWLRSVSHMFEEKRPSCVILSYFLRSSRFGMKWEYFCHVPVKTLQTSKKPLEWLYVVHFRYKTVFDSICQVQLFDEKVVSVNSELISEIATFFQIKNWGVKLRKWYKRPALLWTAQSVLFWT